MTLEVSDCDRCGKSSLKSGDTCIDCRIEIEKKVISKLERAVSSSKPGNAQKILSRADNFFDKNRDYVRSSKEDWLEQGLAQPEKFIKDLKTRGRN